MITAEEYADRLEAAAPQYLRDGQPVLQECAEIVKDGFRRHFALAQSAAGQPWPPRKDPRPTHPLLDQTGTLKRTVIDQGPGHVEEISEDELVLGVAPEGGIAGSVRGARRHQYGDQPPGILPRPFVGLSADVIGACLDKIGAFALAEFP